MISRTEGETAVMECLFAAAKRIQAVTGQPATVYIEVRAGGDHSYIEARAECKGEYGFGSRMEIAVYDLLHKLKEHSAQEAIK